MTKKDTYRSLKRDGFPENRRRDTSMMSKVVRLKKELGWIGCRAPYLQEQEPHGAKGGWGKDAIPWLRQLKCQFRGSNHLNWPQ